MDSESMARLARNLEASTDEALIALANRGLVRRAARDLQSCELVVVETEKTLLVHGDGWTVEIPAEGPAAATDDTQATGVTRQIIAAAMHLRDHWMAKRESLSATQQPHDDASAREAAQLLIEASSQALSKWSGKTPLLEAAAAFDTIGSYQVSYAPNLAVQFSHPAVQVLLLTDTPAKSLKRLLDQFKSTGGQNNHARWVLTAVLALKQSSGKVFALDANAEVDLPRAVREDRRRIARNTQRLLAAVAAAGIAHPSSRIVERLRTTGVGAEAAKFPRLAKLLNSMADDAQLQIGRNASANPARLMQRMVSSHALAEAALIDGNANRGDLFGQSRTQYASIGDLELLGLGGYGWRTASGFEGLTTLFWDDAAKRFLSATVARGEGQDRAFSIPSAYRAGIGWSSAGAVEQICRRQLKLSNAKANPEGRLSLSESCQVSMGDETDWTTIDFGQQAAGDWEHLGEIVRRSQPLGLRLVDPRSALVVVRPSLWGERWFDELQQAFVWRLHDEHGAALEVRAPWTDVDEPSIAFLESLDVDRDQPAALLGRLDLKEGVMSIYPLTLFSRGTKRGDKILCPQFDQDRIRSRNEKLLRRLRKKYGREKPVSTRIGDDLQTPPDEQWTHAPPLLQRLMCDLDDVLNAALESGAIRLNPAAVRVLEIARERLLALGVEPLANALNKIAREGDINPSDVLRAAYRQSLFRQSLRLCSFV